MHPLGTTCMHINKYGRFRFFLRRRKASCNNKNGELSKVVGNEKGRFEYYKSSVFACFQSRNWLVFKIQFDGNSRVPPFVQTASGLFLNSFSRNKTNLFINGRFNHVAINPKICVCVKRLAINRRGCSTYFIYSTSSSAFELCQREGIKISQEIPQGPMRRMYFPKQSFITFARTLMTSFRRARFVF